MNKDDLGVQKKGNFLINTFMTCGILKVQKAEAHLVPLNLLNFTSMRTEATCSAAEAYSKETCGSHTCCTFFLPSLNLFANN